MVKTCAKTWNIAIIIIISSSSSRSNSSSSKSRSRLIIIIICSNRGSRIIIIIIFIILSSSNRIILISSSYSRIVIINMVDKVAKSTLWNIFSALFGLIGMAVWLAYIEYPYQAYWSLGLTVLAFTLAAIAGFLLIPDLVQNRFGERLVESRVGTYDDRMTPPTPRPRKVRSHRNFEQDRRYQTSRMYPEKKHPSLKNYPTEKLYPAPRPKHLYDRY